MAFQHRPQPRTQRQIDMRHDAGGDSRLAVDPACAHRGLTVQELRFAQRCKIGGAFAPQHGARLNGNAGADVMAAVQVCQIFLQQIAQAGAVIQVMVAVDHRQVGRDGRFGPQRQPIGAQVKGGGGLGHVRAFGCLWAVGAQHFGKAGVWQQRGVQNSVARGCLPACALHDAQKTFSPKTATAQATGW
jgi:hypothetical protein